MKAAKWRDLSEDELLQKARDLSEEIFNLRFQLSMGVAKNPSRIGQARRDLARAYTIRRERGGAPRARTGRAPGPTREGAPRTPKPRKARATAARTNPAKSSKRKAGKTATKKK